MEVNIVFIDDFKELMIEQANSFYRAINKCKSVDDNIYLDTDNLDDGELTIKDAENTIHVFSEEICFSMDNSELTQENTKKIDNIKNKYDASECLYVIDLCLDNNDAVTGERVGRRLEKIDKNNVLYTSGTTRYWRLNRDDISFIRRASHDKEMDDKYATARRNPLYFEYLSKYRDRKGIYQIILSLLEAPYVNEQYYGVVLLKAIEMNLGNEDD